MTELFGAAFVVSFVCAFVVVCAVMVGGRNGDARVPYESVIHFRLEHKP